MSIISLFKIQESSVQLYKEVFNQILCPPTPSPREYILILNQE